MDEIKRSARYEGGLKINGLTKISDFMKIFEEQIKLELLQSFSDKLHKIFVAFQTNKRELLRLYQYLAIKSWVEIY